MKIALIASGLLLIGQLASAYILPTRTILQKTTEHAGSGIYAIEQEVQFSNGDENLLLKETWLIDGEKMRLTVTGGKDLQNSFRIQFIYASGHRHSLVNNQKKSERISDDFMEKYLNFRNPDALANSLVHLKILPPAALSKKAPGKTAAEFKYEPESWVRLSRTGGVVNYAFGVATPVDQELNYPGLWIEQDEFVLRKIRLPNQAEMSAQSYSQFARGLQYPRQRTIRWGNNSVNIRLISASARPAASANLLAPASLDTNTVVDGLQSVPARNTVMEFYSRFR